MKNKLIIGTLAILLVVSSLIVGLSFGDLTAQAATTSDNESFTYAYGGQVFTSEVSIDDAWRKAMRYQFENGLLTMDEIKTEYSAFSSRGITETESNAPQRRSPTLTGRAQWQPNVSAAYLPLQRVKVELYIHHSGILPIKLDETYTDDNGNFIFNDYSTWLAILTTHAINPVALVYQTYSVRIYPESYKFRVGMDWLGVSLFDALNNMTSGIIPSLFSYSVDSSTHTWVWETSGSFGDIKVNYDPTNDNNKAFYISQALVMGQRFVQDVHGTNIHKFVNVLYPFADVNSGFCWDSFMAISAGSKGERFNDWEMVLHEYGHFIQANVNTNNISPAEYITYGPTHTYTDDHMASVSNGGKGNKSFGAKLAWTEAWATAFSMAVIDNYSVGYYLAGQTLDSAGIQKTASYLTRFNGFDVNYYYKTNMCEGQEDAVTVALWSLYKPSFLGKNDFWNTTTKSGIYTFSDYMQSLYSAYPANISQIGQLLATYHLAPGKPTVSNASSLSYDTSPTISWVVNGSQYNKLNSVKIAFYDESKNLKYTTGSISVSSAYNSPQTYSIPLSEWRTILGKFSSSGSNIAMHISIMGYNSSTPVTGPYTSEFADINIPKKYTVVYNSNKPSGAGAVSGTMQPTIHEFDTTYTLPSNAYSLIGWTFSGWNTKADGSGISYANNANIMNMTIENGGIVTLFAKWTAKQALVSYTPMHDGADGLIGSTTSFYVNYGQPFEVEAPTISNYTFNHWMLFLDCSLGEIGTYSNYSTSPKLTLTNTMDYDGSRWQFMAVYTKNECIAEGALITLADGRQVPVESLKGDEWLLVWNLHTGTFDIAPILFIDSDPAKMYEIIHLYFSDGTDVKVISEHAFWDFDLNQYVFLRNDAEQYIGHWFNKQTTDESGQLAWKRVQLVNVEIYNEVTTAWSPVTFGHLCYYVNGMLSMPGATTGLINIFEVDGDTMTINQEAFLSDIEEFGLFTYEEFAEIFPVPEIIFEAFGGQFLKISIGKGLITFEQLGSLIESYTQFFL